MHHSRVMQLNNKLIFHIKRKYNDSLPENFNDITLFLNQFKEYTENKFTKFTVNKLYWKESINFEVVRNENCDIFEIELTPETAIEDRSRIQVILKTIIEMLFKIYRNKRQLDELKILCCPYCHSDLSKDSDVIICKKCNKNFIKYKGYWDFR